VAASACILLPRDGFKGALDSFFGVCTIALYFLYLNTVKGALSVFDCSVNKDGVRILDSDPSITCDVVSDWPCLYERPCFRLGERVVRV
jgi:hypothetical protein